MKIITITELEKVKQDYLGQVQEIKNRLLMLEGALQATDQLIKFTKGEIQMETSGSK